MTTFTYKRQTPSAVSDDLMMEVVGHTFSKVALVEPPSSSIQSVLV
jgi:hypothetical protein